MTVSPCDPDLAKLVLGIGLFAPDGSDYWVREISEEGTRVRAGVLNGAVELIILPAISLDEQHQGKRLVASVYFEIAAKLAEKTNGVITQYANVGACKQGNIGIRTLAVYPGRPLLFENICPGFQAVLMPGGWI